MLISDAQAAANRANAHHATGPRTARGKANVRRNAHRHGLYDETAPDTGEDAAAFAVLLDDLRARFAPEGAAEAALVARLASILWRLSRVPAAEHAVYAALEHDFVPADDPGETPIAVDLPALWGAAHRAGHFDSPLARINRHEAHLQRMHQRTLDMLNTLQALRTQCDPLVAAKTTARRSAMSGPPAWVWYEDDDDLAADEDDASPNDPPSDPPQAFEARAAAPPDQDAVAARPAPPADMHALARHIETLAAAQGPHAAVPPAPDAADPDDEVPWS